MRMDQQAEEISCVLIDVPEHRSRYVSVELEHLRVIVTIGKQIGLSFDRKDGVVKLTTLPETEDREDIQRCANFIKAVILGFSIPAARKLLYRDDLNVDTLKFSIKDKDTKQNIIRTKSAIEDLTRTDILVNKDSNQFHILGNSSSIKDAKDYVSHLITLYPDKI